MKRLAALCAPLLVGALLLLAPVTVDAASRIGEIRVEGVDRVDVTAVTAQIGSEEGQALDPEQVDADVKAIYGLGFFDRVWVTAEERAGRLRLVYHVAERPFVEEVVFEGVEEVTQADLEAVVGVRTRTIFDPSKAWQGVREARKYYASNGYADATVEYELEVYGENQARVVYRVSEGELIRVTEIRFEGVNAFSKRKLRRLLGTKEKWFLSFLTGAGLLNEDELAADVEKLAAFYYENGYINVKIDEPVVERREDGLEVTFKVDEGPQYRVGDIGFVGDLLIEEEELRQISSMRPNDVFSASTLREAIFLLVEAYGNLGYAFAEVVPLTEVRPRENLVDVTYRFKSGPVVTVRRVVVRGNTKTRDHVVRRELEILEGKRFSGRGLRRSRENIERLGYFSKVELTTNRTERDDEVDLLVEVAEGRTGTLSAGAGFSSSDNFIFNARIAESNLFGRGQSLVFNTDFGTIRQNIQFSLTEPWFGGIPLSVGGDVFSWELEFDEFTRGGTGLAARASYPLGELGYDQFLGFSLDRVRVGLEYRLEESEIDGISIFAPASIRAEEGTSLTSSVSPRLIRSTLNHPFDPTKGSRQILSAEFAGLGGETEFVKFEFSGRWYLPVYRTKGGTEFTYAIGGTVGYGIGDRGTSGEELPLFERYFPGGINSIRGYDTRSLGPREPVEDSVGTGERRNEFEPVGGSQQLIINNDFIFPIVPDAGLKGVVFFDAGNAFTAVEGIDIGGLRYAVGFGLRWLSPLGPLRVEIGYPLDREEGEDSNVVLFSFGAPF